MFADRCLPGTYSHCFKIHILMWWTDDNDQIRSCFVHIPKYLCLGPRVLVWRSKRTPNYTLLNNKGSKFLKSYCSVEGYWGSLDRAHDVLTVTIMSLGDQRGGERNGSPNLCTVVMTHNDLCTCIALTKWDGPVACVKVTENVGNFQGKCYHFTATKTSLTVSVKQYEHDRVTRCTFLLISK